MALVSGFKEILNHCLKLDGGDNAEEDKVEDMLKDLGKETAN